MNLGKLAAIIGLAVLAGPATAQSAVSEAMVAQCVRETRAPGAYTLSTTGRTVLVQATTTGTARGARDVNDCIKDKLQIQYGSRASTVRVSSSSAEECKRLRNQRIVTGLALTAGVVAGFGATDSVLVGAAGGTTAGIIGLNRKYRECLAMAGNSGANLEVDTRPFCSRRGVPTLYNGSSYCIGRR